MIKYKLNLGDTKYEKITKFFKLIFFDSSNYIKIICLQRMFLEINIFNLFFLYPYTSKHLTISYSPHEEKLKGSRMPL